MTWKLCTAPIRPTLGSILPLKESIVGRAVREKRTVIIGDVTKEPDYKRVSRVSIQSEIAVPIFLGDDKAVIGALNLESSEPEAFQGFSQIILESFADKVRALLAFAKLRSDLTDAIEVRNADNLLVAVGDQTTNMIHRLNDTVGVMRYRILELQKDLRTNGQVEPGNLAEALEALRQLADSALEMPTEISQLLSQQGSIVDVSAVVAAEVERLRFPPNVALDLRLSRDIPPLSLYCFEMVAQNLLQNALDAMPDGGTLTVSTSMIFHPDLPGGYVQLAVTDTGVGISREILPKIFELNFTTKNAKGKGHGLGLWWIRNFVRRAGGEITVMSTVGAGSTFVVRIPYERGTTDAESSNQSDGGSDGEH